MTEKEKEILLSYLVHEDFRLEDEVKQLQARVRTRNIDSSDCFELALAFQRRDDFTEFALIVLRLLHIEG